jgi:hypothetical protein
MHKNSAECDIPIHVNARADLSDSSFKIAGHVSRKMLERYGHVRMEALCTAWKSLANSSKLAGYDTNHDTKALPLNARPV